MIGIVAGLALAAQGESEVRVAAIRHDDGKVEVAVQQYGTDGWGERQLPQHRFLSPDSTGEWRVSSAVGVETEPIGALNCIVHHGAAGDPFWRIFDATVSRLALRVGLANLEIHAEPELQNQAAAISGCAARGATFIATTIPGAEELRDAANAASESGAYFMTFNSGADLAGSLGSRQHVGLNDTAAGENAGIQFNAAEVSGTVLCVVHEPENVGLAQRCDGLAAAYEGEVQRLDLSPESFTDTAAATVAIAASVSEHNAGAILVLNDALVASAVAAADGQVVGAVAAGSALTIRSLIAGDVLFLVNPAGQAQARALVATMLLESNEGALVASSDVSRNSAVTGPAVHLIRPRIMTGEILQRVLRGNPELLEQLGVVERSDN
ncbi:MAG: substrate-binding domain-containing protein [Chloroflexi bacterium]|nr:substrate-binding domain-containing protein [Chloroflexota bacterium]